MIYGYSRISKGEDQSNKLQLSAFKKSGVEKIFSEKASGGKWERPKLHEMINEIRKGDVVVVWKLDRLSRSLKDLLVIIDRINKKEAGFKSLTENIDTTTASGRMMMQMVGAFAEFEREMVKERTKAGLDAARAEGRVGGQKPKLRPDQKKDVVDNVMTGRKSGADMARLYNVSEATISRIVAQYRLLNEKMEVR